LKSQECRLVVFFDSFKLARDYNEAKPSMMIKWSDKT
jgi:hypothetical protein